MLYCCQGTLQTMKCPMTVQSSCWMPLEIHILVFMFLATMNTGLENMRKSRK